MKQVELMVKHVKGFCSAGYQLSDKILYNDPIIESRKPICLYAVSALTTYLSSLGRDTDESDWINQLDELQCPDPKNTVLFSVKRI